MTGEGVELRWMDDPRDSCRVYRFEVRISQHRFCRNKWIGFWWILRYLWKAVRADR